ncbi:hypothetical protein [Marinobacter sp.]|uniref:hypothetical protein n=1 Tax=Marinobacter sp. TaxID=50741 RepID=UPI0025BE9EAC|nr:hypothetical protein [Marinobacter sp.]|tara:strand:+ start:448 stop:621 length:174 start_codon:yes stop_codon:yes gene_type:complete
MDKLSPWKQLEKKVNRHLEKNSLLLREGSIVDATIISAPSSTKNDADKPEAEAEMKG